MLQTPDLLSTCSALVESECSFSLCSIRVPPIIPHQSNSLFYSFLFLSLFIAFLIILILEDYLGFTLPTPLPLRTMTRLSKRLPLPASVKMRAMAVGRWAEEMSKVGKDDDWRDFLGGRSDRFSSASSRGGFYSRLGGGVSGGRELTRGGNILRNRSANHHLKGSEEIALLSRDSITSDSTDDHDDSIGASSNTSSISESSTRAYATALREICSRALSPITFSNTSPSSLGSKDESDPNELYSSSNSASIQKGKKKAKAKSSLDETLPSIINNGAGGPTIHRASTPPLRPISPSTASLLRTHAHSPPIRSPLGLTQTSSDATTTSVVNMKEVDPFDSYEHRQHELSSSSLTNGSATVSINGSRRPSYPPFSSSKLARSSSMHSPSVSQSKPRSGYENVQTPGASPPSTPSPAQHQHQHQSASSSSTSNGGVLVQVS